MKRQLTFLLTAGAALAAAGCATPRPPSELVQAREEYAVASTGPAAQAAPVELREAAKALYLAESAFVAHPGSEEVRDLAYVAQRKAQVAESLARTELLRREKARAEVELQSRLREQQARSELDRTRAQLAEEQRLRQAQQDELARTQAEAEERERQARLDAERQAREQQDEAARRTQAQQEAERQAREQQLEADRQAHEEQARRERDEALARAQAAEQKAQQALDELQRNAQVREEARGTVITLPGSLLFASGQAELLPSARTRLDQVADALKQMPDQKVRIEGHTDSRGSAALNEDLSVRRAEAVRTYLDSRGVDPGRVAIVGFGASRPIADNRTAEGRATNRRVEIVLERGATGVGGGGQQQP